MRLLHAVLPAMVAMRTDLMESTARREQQLFPQGFGGTAGRWPGLLGGHWPQGIVHLLLWPLATTQAMISAFYICAELQWCG